MQNYESFAENNRLHIKNLCMAYSDEKKAGFAKRLEFVKQALKERKIKYYAPAALAFDSGADVQQLRNVMNGGVMSEKALVLLEKVAGIAHEEEVVVA